MARPIRNDVPGAVHHVTCRGNGGDRLFLDDRDYNAFLQELEEAAVAFEWVILAYCLMPNHVHLLLECPSAGLSRGMQRLESRFARRLHRRYGTFGHVYQGRFKSKPVETDEHLLLTAAYIARNPTKANLCADPGDWPWSSHRAVVHEQLELVDLHRLTELFGAWGGDGRERYLALLDCTREGVPPPRPLVRRPPLEQLLGRLDDESVSAAFHLHGYGVREIAAVIGSSPATVQRWLARMRQGVVKRV